MTQSKHTVTMVHADLGVFWIFSFSDWMCWLQARLNMIWTWEKFHLFNTWCSFEKKSLNVLPFFQTFPDFFQIWNSRLCMNPAHWDKDYFKLFTLFTFNQQCCIYCLLKNNKYINKYIERLTRKLIKSKTVGCSTCQFSFAVLSFLILTWYFGLYA